MIVAPANINKYYYRPVTLGTRIAGEILINNKVFYYLPPIIITY